MAKGLCCNFTHIYRYNVICILLFVKKGIMNASQRKFSKQLDQNISVFSNLKTIEESVVSASGLINNSIKSGGKLMLCGNGGSAADSQHIAAELVGRLLKIDVHFLQLLYPPIHQQLLVYPMIMDMSIFFQDKSNP